ncbi:MAG: hypothetical protein ABI253_04270 [Mycobacterium sp.]
MTTALYYETASAPSLAQLEQRLNITRGRSVAVINAPHESALRLLAISRTNPDDADVVIAFATRRVDLAWLKAVYSAAGSGRTGWVVYSEPGQPGTDLRWEWFIAALRQYGVQAVQQVPIDGVWSAVLLQRIRNVDPDEVLVGHPVH